jgi:hypothetical protein
MFLKAYWGEIYLYLEVMFDLYIFSPAQDKLKKRFDVDVCKKWMQHVEDVKSEVCIIYHDSNCDKTQHLGSHHCNNYYICTLCKNSFKMVGK